MAIPITPTQSIPPRADFRAAPRPAAEPESLAELRERLQRGLDRLAAVVAESLSEIESNPREDLSADWQTLEHDRAAFQSEVDAWQDARAAQVEQLEHDRRLLAEAWDRLEREQIEAAHAARHEAPPAAAVHAVAAAQATARGSPAETAAAREVLRQFESLRHDVRRSAKPRRSK